MKSRHPGEPWMHMAMMNKEWTLPSMFNIPTPQGGTRIAKTKSLWPNLPKPKLELSYPVSCINPFIYPLIYISSMTVMSWNDVTIICYFIWGRKSPHACAVQSCWLACTTTDILDPSLLPSLHEPLHKFHVSISMPVTFIYIYIHINVYMN